MPRIIAVYGSPRRNGNTSLLLENSVLGAREEDAEVEEVFLRDLKMSPCLELYACRKNGRCVIKDDFQGVYDSILESQGIMLASPVFFYMLSAHTKILMDRCQSFWEKRYVLEKTPVGTRGSRGKGLFISAGATRGKRLFEGSLLGIQYFFDALDMELWRSLLYRGLDNKGEVLDYPEYMEEAYISGKEMCKALVEMGYS